VLGLISAGCSSLTLPHENGTPEQTQSSVYLFGNGTFNVNGTLQQVNGTLHISSVPSGADVYIDNEYWCPTNCALSYVITPGHHLVEIRMNGYEPVTYPVTVEKGGMQAINATLVTTQNVLAATSVPTTRPP
jgi:hypothetical protein